MYIKASCGESRKGRNLKNGAGAVSKNSEAAHFPFRSDLSVAKLEGYFLNNRNMTASWITKIEKSPSNEPIKRQTDWSPLFVHSKRRCYTCVLKVKYKMRMKKFPTVSNFFTTSPLPLSVVLSFEPSWSQIRSLESLPFPSLKMEKVSRTGNSRVTQLILLYTTTFFPVFGKPFNASQSISPRTPARDKWQIVLSVRRTFKQYKLLESSAELGWRYFKFFDFPRKANLKSLVTVSWGLWCQWWLWKRQPRQIIDVGEKWRTGKMENDNFWNGNFGKWQHK